MSLEKAVHESNIRFCINHGIKLPQIHPSYFYMSRPPVEKMKFEKR